MMPGWLIVPLRILRLLLDWISDWVYGLIYDGSKADRIPPLSDVVLLDSAVTLADKIRRGSLSSEQIVKVFIKRIEEVNPTLNCIVDNRFEAALEESRQVDESLSRLTEEEKDSVFAVKPFLGVPFTAKDCFSVKGLSWSVGLKKRKDKKGDHDADSVRAMREAGAIPIGVTNVSELCMWYESSNNVYGTTKNPYHTGRIVGGSSGGEACTIASGAGVFGIGSDVGGSIRMPAFFCGIFGHKPTTGIVSNEGQLPKAIGVINTFLVTGPMCRYARDLTPMFKVLAGSKKSEFLGLDTKMDLRKLKIFYMEDDSGSPLVSAVHKDLKAAQQRLISGLEATHGLVAKKVNLKGFFHSVDLWSHKMASEPNAPAFARELNESEGEPVNAWWELVKWLAFQNSEFTLPSIGLALLEKFVTPEHPDHQKFLNMCDDLSNELEDLLGDDGVLLYPSHSTPAPYHGQPLIKTFNFAYTAIFNVLGNPSTQVPLGLGSWGVPLGIQIVGGKNRDRNGLALALEVERMFGGWIPPTGVV